NGNIINFLYQNDGQGHFTLVLETIANLEIYSRYLDDAREINNDGFLDLGIATCKNTGNSPLEANQFFLNSGNCNRWLKVRLTGTRSNRSAIGAKVRVRAIIGGQEVVQLREVSAQSGYCGQNSLDAHFGLGDAEVAEEVRIEFPGGADTTLLAVPVDQVLEVTETVSTSVEENAKMEAFAVKVFPNPASEAFHVEVEMPRPIGRLRLRLLDAVGKVILKKEIPVAGSDRSIESFSVREMGLSRGVYWLEISGDGGTVVKMVEVL
ncbi:MAG: ASPIC/UnbV domain-containing protein, partial [Phaeodactylibacter sp.]|nr:ASPIC/UnbV domain-containing protein [Phaeodactylibacter sp.]